MGCVYSPLQSTISRKASSTFSLARAGGLRKILNLTKRVVLKLESKVRNVDCPSALYVYIDRLRAVSRGANASIDPDADVRARRRFAQLRAFRVTETASAAGSEE